MSEPLTREGKAAFLGITITQGAIRFGTMTETHLRVARAALAAERYRLRHDRWPDSLDALVPEFLDAVPEDPYSDGPIAMLRTGDGIIVCSVGPNGMLDDGVTQQEAARRAETGTWSEDRFDIAFRLLDPDRRGVRTLTFREEAEASGLDAWELRKMGFTPEWLRQTGVDEADIRAFFGPSPQAADEGGDAPRSLPASGTSKP